MIMLIFTSFYVFRVNSLYVHLISIIHCLEPGYERHSVPTINMCY